MLSETPAARNARNARSGDGFPAAGNARGAGGFPAAGKAASRMAEGRVGDAVPQAVPVRAGAIRLVPDGPRGRPGGACSGPAPALGGQVAAAGRRRPGGGPDVPDAASVSAAAGVFPYSSPPVM
ncbi:hypothetical protein Ppa06_32960 [Planomonospora parontospora subsp. parontospora]|uniref:Uncharacterized protein n=2 Tax=Planomonospora parontospora TaxID=58119 RepID=A0AA37F5A9_9ACTN|nr:hypothetical protein GCM10010126_38140 [Planomonospora parontospora]GII09498.1 hypothetical protein Ppa06_32960 [Planomonospora parontospora subsp. parontospora]